MNKKGFTLIEILAVIVIIGIASTIGIIAISGSINQSRDSSFADLAKTYAEAARTMRASDKMYYQPKDGEAVILPYSEIEGSDIENKDTTGYGDILPSYCYVSVVNEKTNFSYYVTQVDETYHFINNIEYNNIDEDDILLGADQLVENNVKELKAPYSGFSLKHGDSYYDIKAIRASFEATISDNQPNSNNRYTNIKITAFDKKGERNNTTFSGYVKLYHDTLLNKNMVELRVIKSSTNALPAKKYSFENKKNGDTSVFTGEWVNSFVLTSPLYIDIKGINEESITFDIKVGNKAIYENIVTTNKTTLYGQFYSDNSYYSSNVAVKGTLADYDKFATTGKFATSNSDEIVYDEVAYKLNNSKIMYAISKKN